MPKFTRPLAALCALLALALSLAACGSDDTKSVNAYVAEVNAIQNEVAAQFRTAGTAISPTSSRADDVKALTAFDTAVATAVKKLEAVEAPGKVESLHADLVKEVAGYRKAIAAARKALTSSSTAAATAAQAEFARGTTQTSAAITTTIDEINRKLHE